MKKAFLTSRLYEKNDPRAKSILSTAINTVDEIFLYLDTEMKVLWANEAACRSVKLSLDDLLGKHCHIIWNQSLFPCSGCPVKKALTTGKAEELIVRRSNGRDWLLKGYPYFGGDGKIKGLFACMYDVTSYAQAERYLKHSYRFLEIANRHTSLKPLITTFGREIKKMTECELVRICFLHTENRLVYELFLNSDGSHFKTHAPDCTNSGRCLCNRIEKQTIRGQSTDQLAYESSPSPGFSMQTCLSGKNAGVDSEYMTHSYIPIVWGSIPFGIIQIAYSKPGMLSEGLREQLKRIAMELGSAAQRIKAEEGLRKAYIAQEERVRVRTEQLTRMNIKLRREIEEYERAEAALKLKESQIDTLYQLSRMESATLQQICDFVIEKGVRLTQSEYGYLFFMNEDETVLTVHAWSKDALKICSVEGHPTVYRVQETGLWGEAARQRKPIITNDYNASNPLKKGTPPGHVPIKRHMNIPVFEGDHIVAIAGVANKKEPYTESDVRQLQLLMDGMWRFIQRKRADERLRDSESKLRFLTTQLLDAQEKERKRISIELHDEMGQALLTLKMQISAIQKQIARITRDYKQPFAEVLKNIDTITENVRRLSRDLRPSILEDLGLFAALKWLAEELVRHYNITVTWNIDDLFDGFSKEHEILVFRIFQEALTNVAKHSRADKVTISSVKEKGFLIMTIQDNGIGFNMDQVLGHNAGIRGMGIAAMNERVQMLGGTLSLKSGPGFGTCIHFKLPVDTLKEKL